MIRRFSIFQLSPPCLPNVTLLFPQKQLFTSVSYNSYSEKYCKSHRKIAVMFFFDKVVGCDLTKKGLCHSFFWVIFRVLFFQCPERSHSVFLSTF